MIRRRGPLNEVAHGVLKIIVLTWSIFLRPSNMCNAQLVSSSVDDLYAHVALQAWHVGDSLYSDIGGAIGVGLAAAVWVNPMGRAVPLGHAQPTHTIAHIAELQEILAAELQADP